MSPPTSSATRAPLGGRSRLFAVGAIAVAVGAIAFVALGGLGENLVYYWGPSELAGAGEKAYDATIRLGGQVEQGSIRYEPGATRLEFRVTDGRSAVPVLASEMPPQMFREGIGVVVEGTMGREGVFHGKRLMVSHSNEYRAPKPGESADPKTLMGSVKDGSATPKPAQQEIR